MSSSQTLGGSSRPGRLLGPTLDMIIKNVDWRRNSYLVSACKSAIDRLQPLHDAPDPVLHSPLPDLTLPDANHVLLPLILAIDSSSPKIAELALGCSAKLISLGLLRAEIDPDDPASVPSRLFLSICRCGGLGDDSVELAVLMVFILAVRSPAILIRGDLLVQIVKSCYNVYIAGLTAANQLHAKAVLAQIVAVVYARVESNSMDVKIRPISVSGLLELCDKDLNELNVVHAVQSFINEVVEGSEGVPPLDLNNAYHKPELKNGDKLGMGETNEGDKSKIREDGVCMFNNLCKFSMKSGVHENSEDHLLLKEKILSLELLKAVMENAGSIWLSDERFLSAIKQYLCSSLLKNSALSAISVFQLLCSIFTCLLSRFRSGLKSEIGIFFPMHILRVLENVLQPSVLHKMTVLNLLEKMCEDSQLVIDIFVNYDCDMDGPNMFERIVKGLLKTALGVPSGSATTLSPSLDLTFRIEAIKCLVAIIRSMGTWMDRQLQIAVCYPSKSLASDTSTQNHSRVNDDEKNDFDCELNPETTSEVSKASTLEQGRAFNIELQKGISLLNRKPSKGVEYQINAKKVGGSSEEMAMFLKNTFGLDETMVGEYLGEGAEVPLKVMHAYVDSMDFKGIDFDEAIRFFLQGFKLPGEAQKIDRIMEKFAERYWKCNPYFFTSADTAYVLAYSVIMLNADAHNNMIKDKMSKSNFIRKNRGIDGGKDLAEEYLGALYDQIVKNEIKMIADSLATQSKEANSVHRLMGLDTILNLVVWTREEKDVGENKLLIKHIQEQFKSKAGKSESVFYAVTDARILRFMIEVCWGPMLAAFSMTLDQSDDKAATFQCLLGFRHAVHITSVMCMQTQRDAFVTSVAKFTYLHNAADMKQKNIDAVKAIISIAIEDGNYLEEAWEHILTCLSRFDNLQLLGEGAPPDASVLTVVPAEIEEKQHKLAVFPSIKKKGSALKKPAVMAVVRGGSYDSTSFKVKNSGPVTPEQINCFISNLHLLEQIGSFELEHIFAHSQRLNSEAVIAFLKALCKVSMAELQPPTEPHMFTLTKIVEIAHYNLNRIRLVWTHIWDVLSDFFVSVGLSENLSVAIFVMDSLRQLAMTFLELEELSNFNFQYEFLRPFVIVMQKSNSAEIRELIVRCISQISLSRVSNMKSAWRSVFMVFATAAADKRKNIVLLAFENMEKIVKDYFPIITETETTTFTHFVRCLIAFTNSRNNNELSLNAVAFLRFCAVKLAEGGLVCYEKNKEISSISIDASDGLAFTEKDDYIYYWVPLLTGLSKLSSDPRPAIRKSALEVLFNILKDHGHLFSRTFWIRVFNSIIFPIFSNVKQMVSLADSNGGQVSQGQRSPVEEESASSPETCRMAAQCLVEVFVNFFNVVRSLLPNVISVFMSLLKSPNESFSRTGVAALVRLASNLGDRMLDKEWREIMLSLKEAALSVRSEFTKLVKLMDNIELTDADDAYSDTDLRSSDHGVTHEDVEDASLVTGSYVVARIKNHIAVQLLITQVITDLYKANEDSISVANTAIIIEILSSITLHAHDLNSQTILHNKLHKLCSISEISDPPVVHFENESHQNYLNFLQTLLADNPAVSEEMRIESQLIEACQNIIKVYLNCAGTQSKLQLTGNQQEIVHWRLPLGSAKKEQLSARTSLVVLALQVLSNLEKDSFKRNSSHFFPLLVDLVRCEHSSHNVQQVLRELYLYSIGPIIMSS